LLPPQPTLPAPDLPAPQPVNFFSGSPITRGYAAALEWRFVSGGFDVLGQQKCGLACGFHWSRASR
jgi:hypothetical protein